MNIVPDETKLTELLLYVAEKFESDPKGGATKVNKALHAAELSHMRTTGRPITGVEYQKLDHGPAPRRLLPVRDRLVEQGAAELRREFYMGRGLDRLVPLRPANTSLFTKEELAAVDQAVAELWDSNAEEASRMSHKEMGWRMVEKNETIPWEAAYLAPAFEVTESMRDHAAALAKELGL